VVVANKQHTNIKVADANTWQQPRLRNPSEPLHCHICEEKVKIKIKIKIEREKKNDQ